MLTTILDAKARLEGEGLHVACNNPDSLWIAANVRDVGEGIRLSKDACALLSHGSRWVAVFPADGGQTYEVPGTLPELVALITDVYRRYQKAGGEFKDAVKQAVTDPEQYLGGRNLTRV